MDKIPELTARVSGEPDVAAFFLFGSAAMGKLTPLSDLDFALLLSFGMSKAERFSRRLALEGILTGLLGTDEIDVIVLNDCPPRMAHRILKEGKLLYCGDREVFSDYYDQIVRVHLDFTFFRDNFDRVFVQGIKGRG